MLSRRQLMGLSIIAAMGLYALLFIVAPKIHMLETPILAERIAARFRVQLRDPDQLLRGESPGVRPTFQARPGSVADLLRPDSALVAPVDLQSGGATIPNLTRRIAREPVPSKTVPVEASIKRLDARILEITQDLARRDIEVSRQLVRPSEPVDPAESVASLLPSSDSMANNAVVTLPPSGLPSLLAQGAGILQNTDPGVLEGQLKGSEADEAPLEMVARLPELSVDTQRADDPLREAITSMDESRDVASMDDLLDMELSTWRSPGDPQGYFQLRIVPKQGGQIEILPKDVTFVVDASSSIPQHKLNLTVKGLRNSLIQLRPVDRFNVVIFRDTPQHFRPEVVVATPDNVAEAQAFLESVESKGETDVYRALLPVVAQVPREGTPGVVVVVSDGRPTAGMRDGRTIINGLSSDNQGANGIYAFGGGRTVNRYLLDLLAYRNKGATEVVSSIDAIDTALPQFIKTLENPILVNLSADFGRIDEQTVYPQELPDFFGGQAVTLYGRYEAGEDKAFSVFLSGDAGSAKKEVIFRTDMESANAGTRAIADGWAFQKAYDIIGRISRDGELPEYLDELKRLRVEYGVKTSYDE